jgi:hypothetical protein
MKPNFEYKRQKGFNKDLANKGMLFGLEKEENQPND